jgi:hypothetical protein
MTKISKPRIFIPILLLFLSGASYGQHIELTPAVGGTFAASINGYSTYYNRAKIGGSWNYGGSLDFFASPYTSISLTYYYQPTTGYVYGNAGYVNKSVPLHVSYIFLGGNKYVGSDMVKGYGGLGVGLAILAPSGYASATKLAFDLHLGVKIDASERIGIRMQVQLYAPVDGGGFGIGVGSGGAVVGVSTYSTIIQFGGNLGLVFRFGGK